MLEVQKLYLSVLQDNKDTAMQVFAAALEKIGVGIRDYPEHKFMHLDYSQFESEKNHPIVIECRGILMDYSGNIVCKSFDRFFNLGENGVNTFAFADSIVYEKADGSLCRVYFNEMTNKWEIATRGTAFAEGPNEWHGTFRNFMLHCMGRTEEQFQDDCEAHLDKGVTYIFEAIGPDNRIVTKYDKNMLVYLGGVRKFDNIDICPMPSKTDYFVNVMGWNVRGIKEYAFATQAECMATLKDLPNLEEGYVVYNKLTGDRVKIKSPAYVAAHRLRGDGLTINALCDLVAMNEVDEYVAVFPEDAEKFVPAQEVLAKMKQTLTNDYATAIAYMKQYEEVPTAQKEFALYVKDLPLSSVMFSARKKKIDIVQAFDEVDVNRKAMLIKERLVSEKVNS